MDSCRNLSEDGFEVTYLPVQSNGVIRLEDLEAAIRPDTSIVSIMTVNNETGVIQPIKEIGALLRKHRGIYFHTDAAQAVGKIDVNVNEMNVDLMSISGQKIFNSFWSFPRSQLSKTSAFELIMSADKYYTLAEGLHYQTSHRIFKC